MITTDTPAQLDALALTVAGLPGADAGVDAQLVALIAEPMLTIDGRKLATGFRYTLNVTAALQLRPKHWFMRGLNEYDGTERAPANMELSYTYVGVPGSSTGCNSDGNTIGLATCGAICHAWAMIIRMWLADNYPLAVPPA